ncbi:MAG: sensor histidine kinase [Paenibacillaceae bacterium]|nr:sensor histidine kinase [Paenibacillaceae bacterium]
MKPPMNSFLFRLILYFILVGALPFAAGTYWFYHESTLYAKQEMADSVQIRHAGAMQRLQRSLASATSAADVLSNDPDIQQYVSTQHNRGTDGELALQQQNATVILLRQFANRVGHVTQVCLLTERAATTVCLQPLGERDTGNWPDPAARPGFVPSEVWVVNRTVYGLTYNGPVIGSELSGGEGRISMTINLSDLMEEIEDQGTFISRTIVDASGNVVYRQGEQSPAQSSAQPQVQPPSKADAKHREGDPVQDANVTTTAGTITSQQNLRIDDQVWTSQWVVGNRFHEAAIRALKNAAKLFAAILLLLCWIGGIIFSRYITRPLNQLRSLMTRAERGDLKAYWVPNSAQEINELGHSYNQMLNRLEDLIKQVKREESLKKEAEIEALQYQLNPHFLYNTLNTIKWVAKLHKTPQISEVISALVRLLQASLGKKGDFITLREEVGLIRDYMEIQRFRYGDRVQVNFEVDQLASLCLVPRMILQPLVENACIHGIEPSKREGLITIRAWIDRDLLFCEVEDNGIGMKIDPDSGEPIGKTDGLQERMSGIGLRHIREKIKLYYGNDYKMRVISKEQQGSTIRLSLPVHQSEV